MKIPAGILCLTYDDGPGRRLTPLVLRLLAHYDVRATFFLLGRRALMYHAIVDSAAAAGHELACHSFDHLHAWKCWPLRVAADIDRGYESLAEWVNAKALFRPPYGKTTPLTRWQVRRRGAAIARWTRDSMDTTEGELPSSDRVVETVVRDGGGVVLLHDYDRSGDQEYNRIRAAYVLEVSERLLDAALARRWRVMTMSDMLRLGV